MRWKHALAAALAVWIIAPCAWAADAPEHCYEGYTPNADWAGAEMLKGTAATPAAILARHGRPLLVWEAQLKGTDFSGRELTNVCFEGGDFTDSHWARAKLRRVVFSSSKLRRADFDLVTADATGIYRSDLSGLRGRRSRWRDLLIVDSTQDGGRYQGERPFDGRIDFTGAELTHAEWRCEMDPNSCNQQFDLDLSGGRLDGFVYRSDWRRLRLVGTTVVNPRIEPRSIAVYAQAKVVGEVVLSWASAPSTTRLTPLEWSQLKNGLTERWPEPLTLGECRGPTRPALRFMCGPKGPYEYTAGAAWYYDGMMQARELALEAGLAMPPQTTDTPEETTCLAEPKSADDCLGKLYQSREKALQRLAPPTRRFAAGEAMLFADSGEGFSRQFRGTPTYAKLVPVLYEASRQRLYVTGLGADRISIQGFAISGNNHSCYLDDTLSLRPDGWYGLKDEHGKWWDVLRVRGDSLEVGQDYTQSEYGCGGVAYWVTLWRLPVSAEVLKKKAEPRG